ncbi:MAG TPA: hypothetical protein VFO62_10760 [Candidatus Binatia bacterium]|nr:hypothetical protein [Candidatus Binatia bacterium]
MAAALKACTCSWPIVRAETETEHEPWCTAHAWLLGFMERDEGTPASASVPYKQPTPVSRPKRAARSGRESR